MKTIGKISHSYDARVIAAIFYGMALLSRPVEGAESVQLLAAPVSTATAPATKTNEADEAYQYLQLFTEALMHIKKQYVSEKSYPEIINAAIHGMVESLDPHSGYMEPEALSRMKEETAGAYGGIGIYMGIRDDALTVIAPIEDTPAFRAGIHAGDRIEEIDGKKTSGMKFEDALKMLRGDEGSNVTVTVFRPNDTEKGTRTMTMAREVIEVPSVKGTRIVRDHIGYIRITVFSQPTADAFHAALESLAGQGMKSLVLDLRDNPGGLLQSATDIASYLLPKGSLIVSTRGRKGVSDEVKCFAKASKYYTGFPVAVMINGGSASGSEIVAGAMRDQKRAVLIGEKSFGKGSVQSVIQFKDGPQTGEPAGMRLTTALYYTPGGEAIHGKGIQPDIVVPVTDEEWGRAVVRRAQEEHPDQFTAEEKAKFADASDRQLDRALDLLQAIQVFK